MYEEICPVPCADGFGVCTLGVCGEGSLARDGLGENLDVGMVGGRGDGGRVSLVS